MKIKSLEQLDDILDKELSWRKKELTLLMNNFNSSGDKQKDYYLRVSIFLIYAHWEGFIKIASESYLEYISNQRIKLSLLNSNLIALTLENHLDSSFSMNNINHKKKMLNLVLDKLENYCFIYKKGQVNTQSNLNMDVLDKICSSTGVDKELLNVDSIWIDERLLKYRNEIAHGEKLIIEQISFDLEELKSKIQNSLDIYKNLISNAAYEKSFLKDTQDNTYIIEL